MKGGPVEQDLADMNTKLTAMRIRQYRDVIVGIKVAHYSGPEWDPVTRAVAAGAEVGVPVMVDFGGQTPPTPPLSLEDLLLKYLRPGDILTHTYAQVSGRIAIVDVGEINGRIFLNNSSLGIYPRMAMFKEEHLRMGRSRADSFSMAGIATRSTEIENA